MAIDWQYIYTNIISNIFSFLQIHQPSSKWLMFWYQIFFLSVSRTWMKKIMKSDKISSLKSKSPVSVLNSGWMIKIPYESREGDFTDGNKVKPWNQLSKIHTRFNCSWLLSKEHIAHCTERWSQPHPTPLGWTGTLTVSQIWSPNISVGSHWCSCGWLGANPCSRFNICWKAWN